MNQYKYFVSVQPEDWPEGRQFKSFSEAESYALKIGGVVTEVTFEFVDSELVYDASDVNEDCFNGEIL